MISESLHGLASSALSGCNSHHLSHSASHGLLFAVWAHQRCYHLWAFSHGVPSAWNALAAAAGALTISSWASTSLCTQPEFHLSAAVSPCLGILAGESLICLCKWPVRRAREAVPLKAALHQWDGGWCINIPAPSALWVGRRFRGMCFTLDPRGPPAGLDSICPHWYLAWWHAL